MKYKIYNSSVENIIDEFINDQEKFNLIITSPPYNLGKEYEERKELKEYLQEQEKVIKNLKKILTTDGSICWQIGSYIQDNEVYPLDIFYYELFKKNGFKLRNRIIWHFGHGLHSQKRFSGRYETVLWFTKSDNYKFNLNDVRIKQKYPGKKKNGILSSNPKGKNPSDVWEIINKDWTTGIWNIPNVKSNHVEKTEHPCQFPVELVERFILALTDENDKILDPYLGSGTSIIAALKNNRIGYGIEKEEKYISITEDRIKKFEEGTLKLREIKPIYDHTKSSLSKTPF